MKRSTFTRLALCALALGPLAAQATNVFGDSPMAYFTKDDHAMSKAAIKEALESAPDGKAVTWANPESKAAGSVTPLKTTTENGMSCRLTQFENEAKGKKGRLRYKLCKTTEGSWKAVTK